VKIGIGYGLTKVVFVGNSKQGTFCYMFAIARQMLTRATDRNIRNLAILRRLHIRIIYLCINNLRKLLLILMQIFYLCKKVGYTKWEKAISGLEKFSYTSAQTLFIANIANIATPKKERVYKELKKSLIRRSLWSNINVPTFFCLWVGYLHV